MALVTLQDLIDGTRQRGEVRAQYVPDAELIGYLNEGLADLWELLIQSSEDWNVASETIDVVSGQGTYLLAGDYYHTRAVDILAHDGEYIELERMNFAERNRWARRSVPSRDDTGYALIGQELRLLPTPTWSVAAGIIHHYIPAPPVLADPTDKLLGIPSQWQRYIQFYALVLAKQKGDEDASGFVSLLARAGDRCKSMVSKRDRGEPGRVRDVERERMLRYHPRYGGGNQ